MTSDVTRAFETRATGGSPVTELKKLGWEQMQTGPGEWSWIKFDSVGNQISVEGTDEWERDLRSVGLVPRTGWRPDPKCTHLQKDNDPINHPLHYTSHPSGVECIQITEHMNFCLGNAMKYIWRAGQKSGASALSDLEKARWYITREIERLQKNKHKKSERANS